MFAAGGLFFFVCGIILAMSTFPTPDWMQLRSAIMDPKKMPGTEKHLHLADMDMSLGQFELIIKVTKNGSSVYFWQPVNVGDLGPDLAAVCALNILGLIGIVVGGVGTFIALRRLPSGPMSSLSCHYAFCTMIGLSGIVLIIAGVVFASTIYKDFKDDVESGLVSTVLSWSVGPKYLLKDFEPKLDWCFYLCVVGGWCEIFASILLAVTGRRKVLAEKTALEATTTFEDPPSGAGISMHELQPPTIKVEGPTDDTPPPNYSEGQTSGAGPARSNFMFREGELAEVPVYNNDVYIADQITDAPLDSSYTESKMPEIAPY